MNGRIVLVVGPSGVGKDSLMDGARRVLAGRSDILFPKREITRPAEAGGEDHVAVTEAQYHARRELGGYLLSWGAHGLWYGLPAALEDDLNQGRRVVVNVSRSVLEEARDRFPQRRVISVTADEATLRSRLSARGREDAEQVERRLARARSFRVAGDDVVVLRNDGDFDAAVARFTELVAEPFS